MAVKGNCGSRDLKEQQKLSNKTAGQKWKVKASYDCKGGSRRLSCHKSNGAQFHSAVLLHNQALHDKDPQKEGKSPILTRNEKRLRLLATGKQTFV